MQAIGRLRIIIFLMQGFINPTLSTLLQHGLLRLSSRSNGFTITDIFNSSQGRLQGKLLQSEELASVCIQREEESPGAECLWRRFFA